MNLSLDVEKIIIDFCHIDKNLTLVFKNWNDYIKLKKKIAVNIIGQWYKTKIFSESSKYDSPGLLLRQKLKEYKHEWFIEQPEFIVVKGGLDQNLLDLVPNVLIRKKSDVRNWILNSCKHVQMYEWISIGF